MLNSSESLSGPLTQEYASIASSRQTPVRLLALLFIGLVASHCAFGDDAPIRTTAMALFKNTAVISINGKQRTLRAGKTSPEGVLLVKSDSESATIEIDGERFVLKLDGKIVGHYVRSAKAKSLQLYPGVNGHYEVDGTIDGTGLRFLIDTGATSVSINKETARRIGLLYRVDGSPTRVETAAGMVAGYRVRFDEIKVHSLVVKGVDGIVLDGEFPRTALLGQSFLNRLDMRRDGPMLELKER